MKFDINFIMMFYFLCILMPLCMGLIIYVVIVTFKNLNKKDSNILKFCTKISDVLVQFGLISYVIFIVALTIYGFIELWDLI